MRINTRFLLSFTLILFAIECTPFAQLAFAAGSENIVVVYGDSIAAGIYIPSGKRGFGCAAGESPCNVCNSGEFCNGLGGGSTDFALPDQELDRLLNGSARPSEVVNWGFGGSSSGPAMSSGNGSGRILANLSATKAQFSTSKNFYVLIMYGTNDFSQGLSSGETGFNVRLMVQRARALGYYPVVGTIPPRVGESVSSRNSQITAAALAEGAPLVDIFTAFNAAGGTNLLYNGAAQGDQGLHPTLAGYTVIAESWFDSYLAEAIAKRTVPIAAITLLFED